MPFVTFYPSYIKAYVDHRAECKGTLRDPIIIEDSQSPVKVVKRAGAYRLWMRQSLELYIVWYHEELYTVIYFVGSSLYYLCVLHVLQENIEGRGFN